MRSREFLRTGRALLSGITSHDAGHRYRALYGRNGGQTGSGLVRERGQSSASVRRNDHARRPRRRQHHGGLPAKAPDCATWKKISLFQNLSVLHLRLRFISQVWSADVSSLKRLPNITTLDVILGQLEICRQDSENRY